MLMLVDVRDANVTDRITAYLVSPTEVLISLPSMGYDLYHDSQGRNQRLKEIFNMECEPLIMAQNITINTIRTTHARQVKRLLLRFPNQVRLSNVWDPTTFALKGEIQTDFATMVHGNMEIPLLMCRMKWQVCDLGTHRNAAVARADIANAEILAAQFQRMLLARNPNAT